MAIRVIPLTCKAAAKYVGENHRHNKAPNGGLFACGVEEGGKLVGVAICGRPIARLLDDGRTVEITRVCTDGTMNACSKLYAALCRAAAAVGYERAVTYTLKEEPGASLRAAGFVVDAELPARPAWSTPGAKRKRVQVQRTLFGDVETRPPGPKVRWVRVLNQRCDSGTKDEPRTDQAGHECGIVA